MKGRTYLVRDDGDYKYAHVVTMSMGKCHVECLKEGIGTTAYSAMENADAWHDAELAKAQPQLHQE